MRKFICVTLLIGLCIALSSCSFRVSQPDENDSGSNEKTQEEDDFGDENDSGAGWYEWLSPTPIPESTAPEPLDAPPAHGIPAPDGRTEEADLFFEKEFGSYSIPGGWEESINHSTSARYFYIPQGNDDMEWTDNVSVKFATISYAQEDVMEFRENILRTLTIEISGHSDATLTDTGTNTQNGYLLLTFTINRTESEIVKEFYFIIGDYKYCEVILTCMDNPEEAARAARMIVDSFIWAE